MTTLVAVCWAVVAVLLVVPPGPGRRLVELERGRVTHRSWGSRWFWGAVLGIVAVLGMATLGGLRAAAWTLVVGVVAATAGWVARDQWRRAETARRRQRVATACQVVAGQLRSGAVPRRALQLAAEACGELEPAVATVGIGGDVGGALRSAGQRQGSDGLAALGRAWQLAEETGAPMADLAEGVSERIRADDQTRALVAAELAAPRASSKLLALLPAFGIALGVLAGGDPVAFLTGTPLGLACLVGGVVLSCTGLVWGERMARRAEEGR